jgi:serine/threonine-protein kinase
MSAPDPASVERLPADLAVAVDRVCGDFEADWVRAVKEGRAVPDPMAYLTRVPEAARPALERYLREAEQGLRAPPPPEGWPSTVTQAMGAGQVFGNYELLDEVGIGGQGVVYRARQVHINKEVALKLVNPHDRRRSLRELEIASNLEHENVVRVYHVGEHSGRLYFTMKLAERGSLDKHIKEHSLQDVPATTSAEREAVEERTKQIAGFMAKIARAVHYIHEQGIIHRDPKPRNILLDARGEPLVSDFGLARRVRDAADERAGDGPDGSEGEEEAVSGTSEGAIVGTAGYMAPEQAQGRTDLTTAVDIYGLGAILYKLLTGRTPFVGTKEEMIDQTADPECVPPAPSACNPNVGAGSDLELICRKCLEKEPGRRYASAAHLADDLGRYVRNERTSVRPQGVLERSLRAVIGAANFRRSTHGFERWSAIDLWDAGINLVGNAAMFALIRTDQPPALLWLALLTLEVAWWWMFLSYLFRRVPVAPEERHLALLWVGVTLGGATLLWVYCPPFGSARAVDMLAFYPPWAVVNGVAFFVAGWLSWGRYYLVGLGHFLVAALMPLRLDLAPLVYGVFAAGCMTWGAWNLHGVGRRTKPVS